MPVDRGGGWGWVGWRYIQQSVGWGGMLAYIHRWWGYGSGSVGAWSGAGVGLPSILCMFVGIMGGKCWHTGGAGVGMPSLYI